MENLEDHKFENLDSVKDMSNSDFSEADLSGAVIYNLENCLFRFTDITDSDMTRAKFINCKFEFCDMADLDARGAIFENCEFLGCYLRDSKFCDAQFNNCTIKSCLATYSDFDDAVLNNCHISGNFTNSRWEGAVLHDCKTFHILLAGAHHFPG